LLLNISFPGPNSDSSSLSAVVIPILTILDPSTPSSPQLPSTSACTSAIVTLSLTPTNSDLNFPTLPSVVPLAEIITSVLLLLSIVVTSLDSFCGDPGSVIEGGCGLGSFDFFEKEKNRRRPQFVSTLLDELSVLLLVLLLLTLFVLVVFSILRPLVVLLLVIHGDAEDRLLFFTGLDWDPAISIFSWFRSLLLVGRDCSRLRERGRRSHSMVAGSCGEGGWG